MRNLTQSSKPPDKPTVLRRGWTTGACATAATRSALLALCGEGFADPVTITLPGGQQPAFALAQQAKGPDWAEAGIIKDAGDDPDVTHGALVIARVTRSAAGSGIQFRAGDGVGTVTRPGLKLKIGEPAINPVPRRMMSEIVTSICAAHAIAPDFEIAISVPGGEAIAKKTWNPRLGIFGGLSILGTTGIVIPYSCAAWIDSIRRGIDVARAMGIDHVAGATGEMSEKSARAHLGLGEEAMIDMGDFVGGMLKYLRTHTVPVVTIAGGFAKITKLAQGAMDLHSARSEIDPLYLAGLIERLGGTSKLVEAAKSATLANDILDKATGAGLALAELVAIDALHSARKILDQPEIRLSILVTDRDGKIVAHVE